MGAFSSARPMNGGLVVARGKLNVGRLVAMGSFAAFEACDEGNKGYLSREDYKVAVVMLFGYKPSKMEVESVMASAQQSQSGVSPEEFLNLMSTKKTAQLYHSEARHLFTAFDMQCKGFLSLDDFKTAFRIVAPKLPERTIVEAFSTWQLQPYKTILTEQLQPYEIRELQRAKKDYGSCCCCIREVDQDSDGHISFKEFESAMNYGQDNLSALPFT